jgi:hypothetical protein
MSKPLITIIDMATEEKIQREMTDQEFEETILKTQIALNNQDEIERKIQDAKDAKAAVLNKLGLSEEEARALLF